MTGVSSAPVSGQAGQTRFTYTLTPAAAAKLIQGATTSGAVVTGSATVASGDITVLSFSVGSPTPSFTTTITYSAVGTTPALTKPPGA